MKKILIFVFIVLLLGGGVFYYFKFVKSESLVKVNQEMPTPTPTPEMSTWDDPAQFTFMYPKDMSLDPHPENKKDYAEVELKSSANEGKAVVWVKDTNESTIEDYIKKQKIENALDTTLGDIAAKKFYTDEGKILNIAALNYGYLYLVEINAPNPYWNFVRDNLLSSFKFKESEEETPVSSSEDDSSQNYDSGDEVIE